MRRKVKSLRLSNQFEQRGDAKKIVKMTLALALLPEDEILEGFNSVVDFIMQNHIDVDLQEYVNDVENTWIP